MKCQAFEDPLIRLRHNLVNVARDEVEKGGVFYTYVALVQ